MPSDRLGPSALAKVLGVSRSTVHRFAGFERFRGHDNQFARSDLAAMRRVWRDRLPPTRHYIGLAELARATGRTVNSLQQAVWRGHIEAVRRAGRLWFRRSRLGETLQALERHSHTPSDLLSATALAKHLGAQPREVWTFVQRGILRPDRRSARRIWFSRERLEGIRAEWENRFEAWPEGTEPKAVVTANGVIVPRHRPDPAALFGAHLLRRRWQRKSSKPRPPRPRYDFDADLRGTRQPQVRVIFQSTLKSLRTGRRSSPAS